MTGNGNAEFDLHVFRRRASGQKGDRYTIGFWEGTCQRAICHDACIDGALAAIRNEMEKISPQSRQKLCRIFTRPSGRGKALSQTQTPESLSGKEAR